VSERTAETKKAIRRTTIILVAVALAFYLGFILMGLLRA
jgi:CHASE3 domain sensor protein